MFWGKSLQKRMSSQKVEAKRTNSSSLKPRNEKRWLPKNVGGGGLILTFFSIRWKRFATLYSNGDFAKSGEQRLKK